MTRRLRLRVGAALVGAAGILTLTAAPAGTQQAGGEVVSTRPLDDGRMEAVIALPNGAAGDVPAEAISASQDGEPLELAVERLPGEGIDAVLVIDTSGSMAGAPLDAAKVAATTFLQRLPRGAEAAVVGFGDAPMIVFPMSTDLEAATAAVNSLIAGGETALYDAVQTAAAQFPADRTARRVLVVLSDGGDTVSSSTLDAATAAVAGLDADTTMVALGSPEADPSVLAGLATAGDGQVVPAEDPSALAAIYDRIAALLENQYRLSFTPIPGAPGEATVTVAGLDLSLGLSFPPTPVPTTVVSAPSTPSAPIGTDADLSAGAVTVRAPGGIQGDLGLVIGLTAVAASLVLLGLLLFLPERRRARLLPRSLRPTATAPISGLERVKERATGLADRALDRRDRRRSVETALDAAGIALRPAEFVVIAAVAAGGGAALGLLFGGLLGALVLGAIVLIGCRAWLGQRAAARRQRFADQLPATLQLLSGTIRTGYAVQQALETVAIESDAPTSEEFHRLVTEHRLGRDFGVSLRAMGDRMRCREFDLVVQAIEIHRSVGGDLAEVLDNVAATVRDRNYLRRQVAALSAEGRISAYILLVLPVAVFGLMLATSPDYATLLLEEPGGRVALGLAIGLMIVGFVWLRRLIRLRF